MNKSLYKSSGNKKTDEADSVGLSSRINVAGNYFAAEKRAAASSQFTTSQNALM